MLSDELPLKQSVAGTAATHATIEQGPARKLLHQGLTPGGPGIEPRWTRSTKTAVAYRIFNVQSRLVHA